MLKLRILIRIPLICVVLCLTCATGWSVSRPKKNRFFEILPLNFFLHARFLKAECQKIYFFPPTKFENQERERELATCDQNDDRRCKAAPEAASALDVALICFPGVLLRGAVHNAHFLQDFHLMKTSCRFFQLWCEHSGPTLGLDACEGCLACIEDFWYQRPL